MAIFRCKMCGGSVSLDEKATIGTCEYCNTKQTFPTYRDTARTDTYNRGGDLRRNNQYDSAEEVFRNLLSNDSTDAEAYWSLVLCKFGIEYVEDPRTGRRVPTMNRTQLTSIFDDEDYKSAIRYADPLQRSAFEDEAEVINSIQKRILAVSKNEAPFDIFICYKETDANGQHTDDSVYATQIYHILTNSGYRVFFSRITLEDKLGVEYEPYIFSALHSSKIMIALGTKPQYFESAWVKNEWSRYLKLIKSGENKTLIPAYRDMSPNDLPEEFKYLQALNMGDLGFSQDLLHGIEKILDKKSEAKAIGFDAKKLVAQGTDLAKRGLGYVKKGVSSLKEKLTPKAEDDALFPILAKKRLEAKQYFTVLRMCFAKIKSDPSYTEAYLYRLLAKYRISNLEDLRNLEKPYEASNEYIEFYARADEELKRRLDDILSARVRRSPKADFFSLSSGTNEFSKMRTSVICLIFSAVCSVLYLFGGMGWADDFGAVFMPLIASILMLLFVGICRTALIFRSRDTAEEPKKLDVLLLLIGIITSVWGSLELIIGKLILEEDEMLSCLIPCTVLIIFDAAVMIRAILRYRATGVKDVREKEEKKEKSSRFFAFFAKIKERPRASEDTKRKIKKIVIIITVVALLALLALSALGAF
ncbi:MAG: toll/interleukin-1 receptor domain-containing protein [Clostridia bacterium]|nr:toll/interleukin-1 receptor domain-containing protein [Clostridia bacterium]